MFGISCAPEIFQKALEHILIGCNGCFNYIDDIIVFGEDKTQHDLNLQKVLSVLNEKQILLNFDKCVYYEKEIEF